MEEITSKTEASIILTAGNWGSPVLGWVNPSVNEIIVAPYGAGPLHMGARTALFTQARCFLRYLPTSRPFCFRGSIYFAWQIDWIDQFRAHILRLIPRGIMSCPYKRDKGVMAAGEFLALSWRLFSMDIMEVDENCWYVGTLPVSALSDRGNGRTSFLQWGHLRCPSPAAVANCPQGRKPHEGQYHQFECWLALLSNPEHQIIGQQTNKQTKINIIKAAQAEQFSTRHK